MFEKEAISCGEGVGREVGVILENYGAKEKVKEVERQRAMGSQIWPETPHSSPQTPTSSLHKLTSSAEEALTASYESDETLMNVASLLLLPPQPANPSPPSDLLFHHSSSSISTVLISSPPPPLHSAFARAARSHLSATPHPDVFSVPGSSDTTYDFAALPRIGGFIVIASARKHHAANVNPYDRHAAALERRETLATVARLLPDRIEQAALWDAEQRDLHTTTLVSDLLSDSRTVEAFETAFNEHAFPAHVINASNLFMAPVDVPTPTPPINQLFRTYLPAVSSKLYNGITHVHVVGRYVVANPGNFHDVTHELSLTPSSAPPPAPSTPAPTWLTSVTRARELVQEMSSCRDLVVQQSGAIALSAVHTKQVVNPTIVRAGVSSGMAKLAVNCLQQTITSKDRVIESLNEQVAEVTTLQENNATLQWNLQLQTVLIPFLTAPVAPPKHALDDFAQTLRHLYKPQDVVIGARENFEGGVTGAFLAACANAAAASFSADVFEMQSSTPEYVERVDGTGRCFLAFLPLGDGFLLRVSGGERSITAFEVDLLTQAARQVVEGTRRWTTEEQARLEAEQIHAFCEAVTTEINPSSPPSPAPPAPPPLLPPGLPLTDPSINLALTAQSIVKELTSFKDLAETLLVEKQQQQDADDRKQQVKDVIAQAGSACAKCLGAVGDPSVEALTTLSGSAPSLPRSPDEDWGASLCSTVADDEDIRKVLSPSTTSVQLFVTTLNWNGVEGDLEIGSSDSSFPVHSYSNPGQAARPWMRSLRRIQSRGGGDVGGDGSKMLNKEWGSLVVEGLDGEGAIGLICYEEDDLRDGTDSPDPVIASALDDARALLLKTVAACIRRVIEHRGSLRNEGFAKETKKYADEVKTVRHELSGTLENVKLLSSRVEEETSKVKNTEEKITTVDKERKRLSDVQLRLSADNSILTTRVKELEESKRGLEDALANLTGVNGELESAVGELEASATNDGLVLTSAAALTQCSGLEDIRDIIMDGIGALTPAATEVFSWWLTKAVAEDNSFTIGCGDFSLPDPSESAVEVARGSANTSTIDGTVYFVVKWDSSVMGVVGVKMETTEQDDDSWCSYVHKYLSTLAGVVARISRDGDVKALTKRAAMAEILEGLLEQVTGEWRTLLNAPHESSPSNTERDFVCQAVRVYQRSIVNILQNCDVRILLTGGWTAQGEPAVIGAEGDVLGLNEEVSSTLGLARIATLNALLGSPLCSPPPPLFVAVLTLFPRSTSTLLRALKPRRRLSTATESSCLSSSKSIAPPAPPAPPTTPTG